MDTKSIFLVIPVVAALFLAGGCEGLAPPGGPAAAARQSVPEPINALLPREIRIHPFTGTRVFSEAGGIKGISVRIEAVDSYGDATKAFGQFRFELFQFKTGSSDPKGPAMAVWNVDVGDLKSNRRHWHGISRTYQFRLAWNQPIPTGKKFVLSAVFQSPYTARLFDERVFVSGQ